VGADGVNYSFAMVALVQAHLFRISWSLAVSASFIRLLHADGQDPYAE